MKIKSIKEFYAFINSTAIVKREIVKTILDGDKAAPELIDRIKKYLKTLENIDQIDGAFKLSISENSVIDIDLTYEIEELKRDIVFLTEGEDALTEYVKKTVVTLDEEVDKVCRELKGKHFKVFVTDRDGTFNNYCGRYQSSIQSIYNAVFMCRFAKNNTENSIILTSAPLENPGLVTVGVCPVGYFINAASKGREYYGKDGIRKEFPIEKEKQDKLHELNIELDKLLAQEAYSKFGLVGSGLQKKFGQTTIARQDINNSIEDFDSIAFLRTIKELVYAIDPNEHYFRIEDTGLDIEVILTVDNGDSSGLKDFDKGNGVLFLNEDLSLNMGDGDILVCGDTGSDVPMVEAATKINKNVQAIFVTDNKDLKERINKVLESTIIVSAPDILVWALNKLSIRE